MIGSTIKNYRNTFYLEFNQKTVQSVLDEFGGKCRGLALAIASEGAVNWYGSKKYTVPNYNEWLSESFDNILGACQNGFLREDSGGVQLYLKDKPEKRKKLEAEIAEFTNKQSKQK